MTVAVFKLETVFNVYRTCFFFKIQKEKKDIFLESQSRTFRPSPTISIGTKKSNCESNFPSYMIDILCTKFQLEAYTCSFHLYL